MEDYGQAPRNCYDGAFDTAPLRDPRAPGLEPGPTSALRQQNLGSLIEHGAQHRVAGPRNATVIVDLAGLVTPRGQAGMSAYGSRVDEALRLIDRRAVCQRNNGADSRSCHQPAAHGIGTGTAKNHLVEPGKLQSHHPANGQQRFDDARKSGQPFDELADPVLKPEAADGPTFRPKLRSVPRRSDSTSSILRWTSLRAVSSIRVS